MSLIPKFTFIGLLYCCISAVAAEGLSELGVNIGGKEYKAHNGTIFKTDQPYSKQNKWGYVGGNLEKISKVIHHAADPVLFNTGRWGMKEYRFDIPNGIYRVTLYAAEAHFSNPLERVFNIAIEGTIKLNHLDLVKQYGKYQAMLKSFVVKVTDHQLNINIESVNDQGKLNAVLIQRITPFSQKMAAIEGLKAFPHDNRIGLKWIKSNNEFTAGYDVFCSDTINGPWRKINNELITTNSYIDHQAINGNHYFYRIEAIDIFGNRGQLSSATTASPIPFSQKAFPICLNCGGKEISVKNKIVYHQDQPYNPASGFGVIGGNSISVTNHVLPLQFQRCLEGKSRYCIDLANGIYDVTLEFIEPSANRIGARVFHVYIEDYPVLKNLDIFKQQGKNKPFEITFTTKVADGILNIKTEKRFDLPIISGIRISPALSSNSSPSTVNNVTADSREDRVFILWDFNKENNVIGYNIYRNETDNTPFTKLNKRLIKNNIYRDNDVSIGKKYDYKVTAVNAAGQESPASQVISTDIKTMTDSDFLNMVQKAGFQFFWEEADMETGLIKDNSAKDYVSVAGTGFGLSAMVLASERGFKPRKEIETRVLSILKALRKSQKKYGILFHYLDYNGQPTQKGYENIASSIDTGLLFMGVITVGEYFGGNIKEEADQLISAANWKAFTNSTGHINMSWKPNNPSTISGSGHFEAHSWNYYTDESIICTLLAIAAPNPDFRLSPDHFYKWKRDTGRYVPVSKNYKPTETFVYSWSGAAFTYQFAHCWLNFKDLGSDNPAKFHMSHVPAINWFKNSVNAATASRLYCIDRMDKFKSFGLNSWGPTACAVKGGYFVGSFLPRGERFDDPGNGPIAPYGAGTSIMFLPDLSLQAMKHYYNLKDKSGKRLAWQDEYEGGYGFWDSFNLDTGYVAKEVIAIDQGPLLLAIENYRTGLIQKTFMKNKYIQKALKDIGFKIP